MSDHPIFDTILARRSIRDFENQPVEHEKIEQLLKAAMAAPSACNLQPWAFIVVDEPEMLSSVKSTAAQGKYNAPLHELTEYFREVDRDIPRRRSERASENAG